jgi:programmed cell death protein 5
MSSNRELEAIRQKRLIEIRQQLVEEQQKTEQRQASQVQQQSLLRAILTSEARQRLNRIKLVKPDFIAQLELQLIQIAQTGRVRLPINDEQLKQMLIQLQSGKRETKFRRM